MRAKLKKVFSKWKPIDVFLLVFSIGAILFLNYFPLLYVYLATPKGTVFLGQASFFEPVDTNLYVATIHYGQWGGILLPNLYTSLTNSPVFIYPLLTAVGFIFKLVNPFLLFYLYGFIASVLLITGMVFIINKLGFSIKLSLFATVAICLGGGFGFMNFGGIVPADMNYTHPTFFLTLQKPHEAIAVLSYIASLVYLYFFLLKKRHLEVKTLLPIFVPMVLFTFIYPFFAISFFLISGSFLLIQRKMALTKQDVFLFAILLLSSGMMAGLLFLQFVINPTFMGVSSHISANLLSEILGFGVLIPIFVIQLFWLPSSPLKTFLSVWFIVIFILAMLPVGPGAVFFRGSFFPIVLLAMLVLQKVKNMINRMLSFLLFFCFFLLLVATSMRIFYMRMTYNYQSNPYIYAPVEEYGILSFLNNNTSPRSSVLSLYATGNLIPVFTHNTVYTGHGLQTPNAASKLKQAQAFYRGEDTLYEARKFLLENNISYVVWGLEEKSLYQMSAQMDNHLKEIFSRLHIVYLNNGFAVLSVSKESLDK